MNHTAMMIRRLKEMDDKQITEMLHDIEDIDVIRRIAICTAEFIDNYLMLKNSHFPNVSKLNSIVEEELSKSKSEYEEAREIDDARRYNDYKSDKGSPY